MKFSIGSLRKVVIELPSHPLECGQLVSLLVVLYYPHYGMPHLIIMRVQPSACYMCRHKKSDLLQRTNE